MDDTSGNSLPGQEGNITRKTSRAELSALAAFLLYFAFKAFYFAFSIGENIFPDEVSWLGIIKVFSRSLLPPADSPESYQYGLITRVPTLYFYLMGKILPLNFFGVSDLIFLRCVNACISILTVWYGWKLIRLLVSETAVRLLFIAVITNVTMFTFVSASVSYDNLTNLLAILALYYLIFFFQSRQTYSILLCVLFTSMGMVTKFSFLPYALALTIMFLFHERKNFRSLKSSTISLFSPPRWRNLALSFLCLFFIGVNASLYLGNLVKFGHLWPPMDKVVGLEQAMQYRLFARNYIVKLFRQGEITQSEAQQMSFKYISHIGDRYDALSLIERAAQEKAWKGTQRIDRFRYAFPWTSLMVERTFSIAGHKVMVKSGGELMPYFFLLLLAGIFMIRGMKTSDLGGNSVYLLFISGFYLLILMQYLNYSTYLTYGSIGISLTGRYLFPVLAPICILFAHYLTGSRSRPWQWGISLVVTAFFVYGEFPWFLRKVTPDWFLQ